MFGYGGPIRPGYPDDTDYNDTSENDGKLQKKESGFREFLDMLRFIALLPFVLLWEGRKYVFWFAVVVLVCELVEWLSRR